MEITISEFMVLMDSICGSLSISDNGIIYKFNKETRRALADSLFERANKINISKIEDAPDAQKNKTGNSDAPSSAV